MRSKLLALAIIALAAVLSNCTSGPTTGQVQLLVTFPSGLDGNSTASRSVSEVVRITVTVTGPGIDTPIEISLTMDEVRHTASATFEVPPGVDRLFTVSAYNSSDQVIYSGTAVADIPEGVTTNVAVLLTPTEASTGVTIVIPPGSISFIYTTVPDLVSSTVLVGRYTGPYQPSDLDTVTYIKVAGGWWIKPYYDTPLMGINNDGYWSCNVVTYPTDRNATDYLSYLVRADAAVPMAMGSSSPPVPDEYFATVTVAR